MYTLVHILGDRETAVSVSDKALDAELRCQRHIRSISPGSLVVREQAKLKPKPKAKPKAKK